MHMGGEESPLLNTPVSVTGCLVAEAEEIPHSYQRIVGLVKRTGLFFAYFQGQRLKDFPQALAGILDKQNVFYYDAVYESRQGPGYLEPLSEELLLKVHSRSMGIRA